MFNELDAIFPNHKRFYEVVGLSLAEAMERAARLTGDDSHVLNYQGKIIFAVQHSLDVTGIDWLTEVPGTPMVELESAVEEPAVEEVVDEEEVVEETPVESSTKSK